MPIKIQFFFLKQIYTLFCDAFEKLRAKHILAVFHLAFLECYKASGTSESNRLALASSWEGATLQPPWSGGQGKTFLSRAVPRTQHRISSGTKKRTAGDCCFLHFLPSPYPSLSTILVFYFRRDNHGSLITLSRIEWRKNKSETH